MRRRICQQQLLPGLYLSRKRQERPMMIDVDGRTLFVEGFVAKTVAIYKYRNAQRHALGATPLEFRLSIWPLVTCALRLGAFNRVVNPAHVSFPPSRRLGCPEIRYRNAWFAKRAKVSVGTE